MSSDFAGFDVGDLAEDAVLKIQVASGVQFGLGLLIRIICDVAVGRSTIISLSDTMHGDHVPRGNQVDRVMADWSMKIRKTVFGDVGVA